MNYPASCRLKLSCPYQSHKKRAAASLSDVAARADSLHIIIVLYYSTVRSQDFSLRLLFRTEDNRFSYCCSIVRMQLTAEGWQEQVPKRSILFSS